MSGERPLPWGMSTAAIGVLAFDPQNPNHLYGGGAGGLFEITLAAEGQ